VGCALSAEDDGAAIGHHLVHIHLDILDFRGVDEIDVCRIDEVRGIWIAAKCQVIALAALVTVPGDELASRHAIATIGKDRIIRLAS
jgi:hypothetical protein